MADYDEIDLGSVGEGYANAYTTEEQNTGMTWIDGKPVYRKIVLITIPSITEPTITVTHDIGVVPNLINARLCPAPGGYSGLCSMFFIHHATDETFDFTFNTLGLDWGDQYLILEYTKP
jgi:hypothetical protein